MVAYNVSCCCCFLTDCRPQQPDGSDYYMDHTPPPAAGSNNNALDAPPAYVQELRQQITGLQNALEMQMGFRNQLPPVWGSMGGFWGGYPMHPNAPGMHPEGHPAANVVANAAANSVVPPLAPELAGDPAMAALHSQHVRDMTMLKYEVEKAKTAAELEQIKAKLDEFKTTRAGGAVGFAGDAFGRHYHAMTAAVMRTNKHKQTQCWQRSAWQVTLSSSCHHDTLH